jgi:hypothetical protein
VHIDVLEQPALADDLFLLGVDGGDLGVAQRSGFDEGTGEHVFGFCEGETTGGFEEALADFGFARDGVLAGAFELGFDAL